MSEVGAPYARICWKDSSGNTHRGSVIKRDLADEWLDKMIALYPELSHWIEPAEGRDV